MVIKLQPNKTKQKKTSIRYPISQMTTKQQQQKECQC